MSISIRKAYHRLAPAKPYDHAARQGGCGWLQEFAGCHSDVTATQLTDRWKPCLQRVHWLKELLSPCAQTTGPSRLSTSAQWTQYGWPSASRKYSPSLFITARRAVSSCMAESSRLAFRSCSLVWVSWSSSSRTLPITSRIFVYSGIFCAWRSTSALTLRSLIMLIPPAYHRGGVRQLAAMLYVRRAAGDIWRLAHHSTGKHRAVLADARSVIGFGGEICQAAAGDAICARVCRRCLPSSSRRTSDGPCLRPDTRLPDALADYLPTRG